MLSLKCHVVVKEVRSYQYRNNLSRLDTSLHITLCSYSHQRRMRLWTWCWWNSAVCLDSNVRNKVASAQLRGHPLQIMVSRWFLLGIFMTAKMFSQNALLQLLLAIACIIYLNQHVVALCLVQVYKWLAFLPTAADQEKLKHWEEVGTEDDPCVMHWCTVFKLQHILLSK